MKHRTRTAAELEAMLAVYESKEPEDSLRRTLAIREAQNEERGRTIAKLRGRIQELERQLDRWRP